MASPGQRRGSCGHVMAAFDLHKKCARCRDKKMGDDPCVKGQRCDLCDSFSESQKGMLATPQYQIRKDKKAGTLVSPSKVTVVGPVEDQTEFQMAPDVAHAQERVFTGASPAAQASVGDFVSRQDLELLNNQLEEKFARFEALLSRTNIFSTPKMPVSTIQAPISDMPFINPSPDPGATGPVRPPGQGLEVSPAVKNIRENLNTRKLLNRLLVPVLQVRLLRILFLLSRQLCPVRVCKILSNRRKLLPVSRLLDPHLNRSSPVRNLPVVLLHLLQTVLLSRIRLCQTRNPFRTGQIKTPVRRVNFQILR